MSAGDVGSIASALIAAIALVYAAHQARTAIRLRAEEERERFRAQFDYHAHAFGQTALLALNEAGRAGRDVVVDIPGLRRTLDNRIAAFVAVAAREAERVHADLPEIDRYVAWHRMMSVLEQSTSKPLDMSRAAASFVYASTILTLFDLRRDPDTAGLFALALQHAPLAETLARMVLTPAQLEAIQAAAPTA